MGDLSRRRSGTAWHTWFQMAPKWIHHNTTRKAGGTSDSTVKKTPVRKEKSGEKHQKEQRCQRRTRPPWQSRHTPEAADVPKGVILEHRKKVIRKGSRGKLLS